MKPSGYKQHYYGWTPSNWLGFGRESLIMQGWKFVGVTDDRGGAILFRSPDNKFGCWSIHGFIKASLLDRGMSKLGYRRDKRCRTGWRYVVQGGES